MANVDFALEIDQNGLFDLVIQDGGLKETNTFDSSIIVSFFEERRALASEVPVNFLRRGWWGNTLFKGDFQIGSKIWLLEQARLDTETLNRAIVYAREAFQWMLDGNFLTDVQVTGVLETDKIVLIIRFFRNSSIVATATFERWENTVKFSSLIETN